MVNHVVPAAELAAFTLDLAERIAAKPLFALKLAKEAVNAAEDAQGRAGAMNTAFALHQLAHSHNMQVHGKLIDPDGLDAGDQEASETGGHPEPMARDLWATRKVPRCARDDIGRSCYGRRFLYFPRHHERQEHRRPERRHRRRHRCGRRGVPQRPRATELPDHEPQAARLGPRGRQDGRVQGQDVHGRGAERISFKGVQIAFFSAGGTRSSEFAPAAVKAAGRSSSTTRAFRMKDGIPLVVPEVNPEPIHKHNGVIANPNCSTIIMNVPVWPLHKATGVKRIVVAPTSGLGRRRWGLYELDDQARGSRPGKPIEGEVPAPDRQQPLQPQHQGRGERLQRGREQDGEETRKIFGGRRS